VLQEKLRVAEDLFSEQGCSQLGSNLQKSEAGRGCFLLASLLFLRLGPVLQEKLRVAEDLFS
jgi:hypothetical protein